jgi:hypothetical protein
MESAGAFDRFDDYDFRHCIARHLEGPPEAVQIAHRILGHLEPDGRLAWFAAREARHEIAGYSEDLLRLWEYTTSTIRPGHKRLCQELALQARYALLIAGLSAVAGSIPPEVSAALVRAGIWTRQEAIDWAKLQGGSDALKIIREALSAEGAVVRPDLVELALETAGTIGDPDHRVSAIVALLDDLPPEAKRLAADLLLQISNEGSRLGGLTSLLERWSADSMSNGGVAAEFDKLAESFTQPSLRAEAMAVLAAHSSGADRESRFAEALTAAQTADQPSESGGHAVPSALERVVHRGPQELLVRVMNDLAASRIELPPSAIPGVWDAFLERVAVSNPDLVLANAGTELPNRVREALAVSLASDGRSDEALDIAHGISYGLSLSDTLVELVPNIPSHRFGRVLDMAVPLGRWWCKPVLKALASNQARLQEGLDEQVVAAAAMRAPSEEERLHILAELSVVLGAPALKNLIASLASAESPANTAELWAPVARRLSRENVRLTLALVAEATPLPGESEAYEALLSRLIELGEPEEALRWLDRNMFDFYRGDIAVTLVKSLPTNLVPHLARVLRPYPPDTERAFARCALAPYLPPDRAASILADIDNLRFPLDEVRCLSALLQDLPTEPRSTRAEAMTALLGAMCRTLPDKSLDRNRLLYGATKVLLAQGSEGSISQEQLSRGLKAAAEVTPDELRLAWLIALSHIAPHKLAMTVVGQALELVIENPELTADLRRDLDPDWRRPLLDQLMAKPLDQLAHLIDELVEWLTPADIKGLLVRINDSSGQETRLVILSGLAKVLTPEQRSAAATKEMVRVQAWRSDPLLHALAADMLMDLDPSAALTVLDAISEDSVQDPDILACLIRHGPRRIIERAVTWLLAHPTDEKGLMLRRALFAHAVHIGDREMAQDALSPAASVDPDDIVPGFVELLPRSWLRLVLTGRATTQTRRAIALRAAELGETRLALEILNEFSGWLGEWERLAPLVLAAAPRSSTETLLMYARELRSPSERFVALAALVPKVSRSQQPPLVLEAFANAHALWGGLNEVRVEVLQRLLPTLSTLPQRLITQVWTILLSNSKERGRSEVLTDIRGMAALLCSRFGPDVASLLDNAIALEARPRWP